MAYIKGKKQVNLDILNNEYWSKILILIARGYNTYSKLGNYRRKEENKKLAPTVLNLQFKRLIEAGYILDDKVSRKYNKKEFIVNWNKIIDEFFKYVFSQLHSLDENDAEFSKNIEKELNEMKIKPHLIEWYSKTLKRISEKYQVRPIPRTKLLNNISAEFQDFLIECLKIYIKSTPRFELLSNNFKYHFDNIISSLIQTKREILYLNATNKSMKFIGSDVIAKDLSDFCEMFDNRHLYHTELLNFILEKHFVNEVMPQAIKQAQQG